MSEVRVGSMVRVVHIPGWLTHDLPIEDQEKVFATLGNTMTVTEIEGMYYWVGVSETVGEEVICSGWFILTADCLELIHEESRKS